MAESSSVQRIGQLDSFILLSSNPCWNIVVFVNPSKSSLSDDDFEAEVSKMYSFIPEDQPLHDVRMRILSSTYISLAIMEEKILRGVSSGDAASTTYSFSFAYIHYLSQEFIDVFMVIESCKGITIIDMFWGEPERIITALKIF